MITAQKNLGIPGLYEKIGTEIGKLVDTKNAAYGDAFNKCDAFLKLLYPNGVKPKQYKDMLCIVRIFDKLMRIATDKNALGESPFRDISGYCFLGYVASLREQKEELDK